MTPAQEAKEYALANGFSIEPNGRRYVVKRDMTVVGEVGGYPAALNMMRNWRPPIVIDAPESLVIDADAELAGIRANEDARLKLEADFAAYCTADVQVPRDTRKGWFVTFTAIGGMRKDFNAEGYPSRADALKLARSLLGNSVRVVRDLYRKAAMLLEYRA